MRRFETICVLFPQVILKIRHKTALWPLAKCRMCVILRQFYTNDLWDKTSRLNHFIKHCFLKKINLKLLLGSWEKIWKFAAFEIYGCKGYFMVEFNYSQGRKLFLQKTPMISTTLTSIDSSLWWRISAVIGWISCLPRGDVIKGQPRFQILHCKNVDTFVCCTFCYRLHSQTAHTVSSSSHPCQLWCSQWTAVSCHSWQEPKRCVQLRCPGTRIRLVPMCSLGSQGETVHHQQNCPKSKG